MKSEFWKLLYNRWILVVSFFIPVFALCVMFVLNVTGGTYEELFETKFLQSMYLTQNWFAVLAAFYFGEEFKRSSLRSGLLCCPKRVRFLTAKLGCLFIWMTVLLYITISLCFVAIHVAAPGVEITFGQFLSLSVPVFFSTVEIALITVALTLLLKSGTIAMAVAISLLMGLGHMLLSFGEVMRLLPGICTMNAFYLFGQPGFLEKSVGLICQGMVCVAALGLALGIFMRRSVR